MKNKQTIHFILYVLWGTLCFIVLQIYYYNSTTLRLTNLDSFKKASEEIVFFYEEHWEQNFSSAPELNEKRVYPNTSMNIHYTVYDAEYNFLVASSRDVRYGMDYKEYQIKIDGQTKGIVHIHYESFFTTLCEQIRERQIRLQKACLLCIGLLAVFSSLALYKHKKKSSVSV